MPTSGESSARESQTRLDVSGHRSDLLGQGSPLSRVGSRGMQGHGAGPLDTGWREAGAVGDQGGERRALPPEAGPQGRDPARSCAPQRFSLICRTSFSL